MDNIEIINEWTGQASARRQIVTITVTNVTVGANYAIRIASGSVVEYRAVTDDTKSTIATRLATQMTGGNWTVATAGNVITLTGSQIGESFADAFRVEKIPSSWVERLQEGLAPVVQVVTVTIPTGTTGGTWTLSADFGAGAETTAGLSPTITAADLETAIAGLTTPVPGDVTVTQISAIPRRYELRTGGALAGKSPVWSTDGDNLTGHSAAVVTRLQKGGSQAPEIWALKIDLGDSLRITIDGVTETVTSFALSNEDFWTLRGFTGVKTASASVFGFQYGPSDPRNYTLIVLSTTTSKTISFVSDDAGWRSSAQKIQSRFASSDGGWQLVASATATRTVSFGGNTSDSYFSNWTLQSRLESLASIGAGNVEVITPFGSVPNSVPDIALIHFKGSLANQMQPLVTFSGGPPAALVATGGPAKNEIQSLIITATGGTFDLGYATNHATEIPFDVTGTSLGGILADLTGLEFQEELTSGFTLTGLGVPENPFLISYAPTVTVSLLNADGSDLTGGAVIFPLTVVAAVPGQNEKQIVHLDPTATGGTFSLRLNNVNTTAIGYNAGLDVWNLRLQEAFGAGAVHVAGTPAAMHLEFDGPFGNRPLPLIQINQDDLIVTGSQLSLDRVAEASGPNYWNDKDNWTLGHVPQSGEIAILGSGRSNITRGLKQAVKCQFDDDRVLLMNGGADFVVGQKVRFRSTGTLPATAIGGGESVIDVTEMAGLINPTGLPEANWIDQALSLVCPIASLTGEDPGYSFRTYETPWVTVGMVPGSALAPSTQFKLRLIVWTSTPTATVELVRSTNTVMGAATFSLNADFAGGANGTGTKSSQTPASPSTLFPTAAPFVWRHSGAPLSATGDYYIVSVNRDPEHPSVQVSCCLNSTPVVFISSGTGTHRIGVQLKGLQSYARFTGQLGLTRRTTGGEWIFHQRYLSIDFENPENGKPNLEIGIGLGDGSGRCMIDAGPAYIDARVILSQAGSTEPAVQILNQNLDHSELMVIAGDVGLGIEPTERVAMKRVVAFGGALLANNLDYKQLEDYAQAVRFVTGQASANVVQLRTR